MIVRMVEEDMEMLCWQFPEALENKYLRIFVIGLRGAQFCCVLIFRSVNE